MSGESTNIKLDNIESMGSGNFRWGGIGTPAGLLGRGCFGNGIWAGKSLGVMHMPRYQAAPSLWALANALLKLLFWIVVMSHILDGYFGGP